MPEKIGAAGLKSLFFSLRYMAGEPASRSFNASFTTQKASSETGALADFLRP